MLEQIALAMYRRIGTAEKAWVQRNLFGGLSIVIERRAPVWRLALARSNTWPSDIEERTAGQAFGVPPGAEWNRRHQRSNKRRPALYVTECVWRVKD